MPPTPGQPSPQSFRIVFQHSPEPSWIVDAESLSVIEANLKAEALSGYTRAELLARTLPDLIQPWDAEKFHAALAAGDFASPEFRGVTAFTRSGVNREVDLSIARIAFGRSPVLLVVISDASARMLLEEQLRQAQKMESVGMLAGGIAHDFNNLLTIISGYSHMLAEGLKHDQKNRFAAEQVIKASDRAAALTRQLLSFSRRQVVQSRVLELNGLVQGMVPMLRRLIGEHIDLHVVCAEDLGRMHADNGQIEQVIMNLVVNARDAMPSGGKLLIETRNTDLAEPYIDKHLDVRPGQYVLLAVSDTGVGMDISTRDKVFEPFFTTKEAGQGTGLGLSMVQQIVKRSGGAVEVYSEPGHGTSVKIFFPRAGLVEAQPAPDRRPDPVRGWETVLLVEDEEAVRNLVRAALEVNGYHVLVAANGTEALRASKQYSGTIHLLITDLVMPDMNGRDVARKLHRKRLGMMVLYMSGYTDTALQYTADSGRAVHFIGKPFTPLTLARKVRELLDEKSADKGTHAQL